MVLFINTFSKASISRSPAITLKVFDIDLELPNFLGNN